MKIGRRDFLAGAGSAGCLPSILSLLPVELVKQASSQTELQALDQEVLDFWGTTQPPVTEKGVESAKKFAPTVGRGAEFLVYNDGKFRDARDIQTKELLDAGDVNARLWVHGFKPSDQDKQKFKELQSAALKVDLSQGKKMESSFEILASTSLAAIFPDKKGKLPSSSNLNWDAGSGWGTEQVLPLPGGYGSWRWNLLLQHHDSLLGKVIHAVVHDLIPEAVKFASVISLPAIAKPALIAFNQFLGGYQPLANEGDWLLCNYPVGVFATKEAAESPKVDKETAIPLIPADYIIVPRSQYSLMKPEALTDYELQEGMIVKKGTNENDVPTEAEKVLSEVTYVTLSVTITKSAATPTKSQGPSA